MEQFNNRRNQALKKNNIGILLAIIITVLLVVLIFVMINNNGNNKDTKDDKTTDKTQEVENKTEEKGENKVAYKGTQEISQNGNKGTFTAEVVFADNDYQTTINYKMVVNYAEMDDGKMLSLLNSIDPYGVGSMSPNKDKFNVNGTTDLGYVEDFGYETKITREGKKVTYTYHTENYNNYKELTSTDKENVKKSLEDAGFTVK